MFPSTRKSLRVAMFAGLALLLIAIPALSQPAPGTLSNVQILGAEDPAKQIDITFWLNQHDKAGFDQLVQQMYDRNSPNYHHWLTPEQYQARFAPSAADMAIVKQYLAANHLQVTLTDKFNHAVVGRGTVADVERATSVQLNRVMFNGEIHRMPSGAPVIQGDAGKLIYAVQGLTDTKYNNYAMWAKDAETGKAIPAVPLSQTGHTQKFFNDNCLRATETHTFKSGTGPYAIYTGARYGGSITAGPPNLPPCGYDVAELHQAYGFNSLYRQHLKGNGQTVVIVDAYGSDTITTDANTFAQINALPPLTSQNFAIYYPTGQTNCGGNTCGWDVETSLDVEWSHALAPQANIALVLALDNSSTNLDLADLFAIETGLGSVVSNSWGIPEAALIAQDPGELTVENNIAETGAALGISVNFSSGDSGDFLEAFGEITVSMPASEPYATGIGGTSLFLNQDRSIKMQTGWGNNLTRIASYAPNPPFIPPVFLGFGGGAGGGKSGYWKKPSYQRSLKGGRRLVPDISYLADPYTGVEIIDSENGQQFIAVVGGTSVACPMFSALWAVANQAAGTLLGQAAPLVYALPADAITDITAQNGPNNVSGQTVVPPNPPTYYSPAELVAPVENSTTFMSLLYHGTSTRWYAISFGTDSSLTTGPGWDNVTGLGVPNAPNFVADAAGAK